MSEKNILQEITKAEQSLGSSLISVAIFGSGVDDAMNPYCAKAHELALQLSSAGIAVLTGGGGGIMEAANRGAFQGAGTSIGLCLKIPQYEKKNEFVHTDRAFYFSSFFSRKATFLKHAKAFVCFPGGVGTLDELFEVIIAMRAGMIPRLPLYLIGVEFWEGLVQWLQRSVFDQNLSPKELIELIKVTDDISEVSANLLEHFRRIGVVN